MTVKDTGIGVPKEKIGLLVQKFSQADASTTRKYGGTGLGLAICQGIIEQHGGSIEVRSEGVGKGTTVAIRLPVVAQQRRTGA